MILSRIADMIDRISPVRPDKCVAPMTYVNEVRMHYARLFLTSTEMKIQEISLHCGFEKMEYFCYVFKKTEGCTPSQYRINRRHADKIHQIEEDYLDEKTNMNL